MGKNSRMNARQFGKEGNPDRKRRQTMPEIQRGAAEVVRKQTVHTVPGNRQVGGRDIKSIVAVLKCHHHRQYKLQ